MAEKITSWQSGVKWYLEKEGRSIAWLARTSNTAYSHLSACINSRKKPSPEMLERLELVMHWPPGTLRQFLYDSEGDVRVIEEGYGTT